MDIANVVGSIVFSAVYPNCKGPILDGPRLSLSLSV